MRWNDIANEGAKNILNGLSRNNNLQELNLMGNKISSDLMNEINDKIQKNKTNAHSTYITKPIYEIEKSNIDGANDREPLYYSQVNCYL